MNTSTLLSSASFVILSERSESKDLHLAHWPRCASMDPQLDRTRDRRDDAPRDGARMQRGSEDLIG